MAELNMVWVIALWICIGITGIGIFILWFKKFLDDRRHNIFVRIIEKDGFGNPRIAYDKGGVYVDGITKNKRFFLQKNNVGLDPDNIPTITDETNAKMVFLKKIGLKNFIYVSFNDFFKEISIIRCGEEDVNWAVNAYEKQKAVFGTTMLQQMLPYIGMVLLFVFAMGIVVVVYGKIEIIKQVLQEAEKLIQMVNAGKGGTVIPTN